MMQPVKSFFKENSTLIYFLIAQAVGIGAAATSLIAYTVRLETRVSIMETRGAEYTVARMDEMKYKIAVLEQAIKRNEEQIRNIITEYLKDKNK